MQYMIDVCRGDAFVAWRVDSPLAVGVVAGGVCRGTRVTVCGVDCNRTNSKGAQQRNRDIRQFEKRYTMRWDLCCRQ